MATARPGQRRPALADTVDLLRGALLLRLRRSMTHYRRREWTDVLALVGMLGPLILLGLAAGYASGALLYRIRSAVVPLPRTPPPWAQYDIAPVWIACALTAVAVLLGLRRTGAAAAFGTGTLMLTASFWLKTASSNVDWLWSGPSGIVVLLGFLSGASLLRSGGPRRARELTGRPALFTAVVLALSALPTSNLVVLPNGEPVPYLDGVPLLLAVFGVPLWLLLTAAGCRAFALLTIALSPIFAQLDALQADGLLGHAVTAVIVAPALAATALFIGRALVRAIVHPGRATPPPHDGSEQGTPLTPT